MTIDPTASSTPFAPIRE
ncbi:unnamed protein product, partial [Rotaria sp. Silwood2]